MRARMEHARLLGAEEPTGNCYFTYQLFDHAEVWERWRPR